MYSKMATRGSPLVGHGCWSISYFLRVGTKLSAIALPYASSTLLIDGKMPARLSVCPNSSAVYCENITGNPTSFGCDR